MREGILRAAMPAVALVVAMWSSSATVASQPLQPGLWETKATVELVDSETARRQHETLRKQLAGLPPAQRKQAEAMIPKPGVPLVDVSRDCLTPKQAAEASVFSGVDQDEDCRTEYGERKGSRIPVKLTCDEPPTTGVGEVVLAGPKTWSTSIRTTTRSPGEPAIERLMRTESRWLASDCGSVKPEPD